MRKEPLWCSYDFPNTVDGGVRPEVAAAAPFVHLSVSMIMLTAFPAPCRLSISGRRNILVQRTLITRFGNSNTMMLSHAVLERLTFACKAQARSSVMNMCGDRLCGPSQRSNIPESRLRNISREYAVSALEGYLEVSLQHNVMNLVGV
jgi:hypothetical protein